MDVFKFLEWYFKVPVNAEEDYSVYLRADRAETQTAVFNVGESEIYVTLSEDDKSVILYKIFIEPKGTGLGHQVMSALKAYGDFSGKDINVDHIQNWNFFEQFNWLNEKGSQDFTPREKAIYSTMSEIHQELQQLWPWQLFIDDYGMIDIDDIGYQIENLRQQNSPELQNLDLNQIWDLCEDYRSLQESLTYAPSKPDTTYEPSNQFQVPMYFSKREDRHIINMEDNTKTGADILNTPSETPRFDAPFEQEQTEPFTDEDYESVPPEVNAQVSKVIKEMRAAGTPMPEIMRHAREIIEAYISSNKKVAYTEGGNWFHNQGGNWCEDCVNSGNAPGDVKPTGPLAENVQIACMGCGQQEGALNREFGRDLKEKMPQHPKLPGIGTIPIDLDSVRQTPGKGRDPYDRKKDYYSSIDRLNIPNEHLGFYAPEQ